MPADVKFNLVLGPLGCMTTTSCHRAYEAKQNLDYRCLYASVFFLPAGAFSRLLEGLKSCFFLSLSVTFYYSSIKKTNFRHVPIYVLYLFSLFRETNNSIFLYTWQSQACGISSLAATDDIFLVGGINKVIKHIVLRVR